MNTTTREALLAEALELSKPVHLTWVDYSDELSDEQLHYLFTGEPDKAVESVDEWVWDNMDEAIRTEIRGYPEHLRDAIDDDDVLADQVREGLQEADQSTPFEDLLGNVGRRLLLYKIGAEDANADEPDVERAYASNDEGYLAERESAQLAKITEVLTGLGLDCTLEANRSAIQSLVDENLFNGGVMYVPWYGQVAPIAELILAEHWGTEGHDAPRTITFTDPYIAVHEHWSGAGWMEQFEGTITMPWTTKRVRLDSAMRYGLDETYGLYLPAFEADPVIAEGES